MKVLRTVKVKLHDLKLNLFVRKTLDTDRVLFLSDLIENEVKMKTNIAVTSDLVVVDGRHRWEAYDLNNVEEVEVDIVDIKDEVTLISEAYRANAGGSRPPTAEDTDHTVELLLERKQSIKAIAELISLPVSITRKYVGEVKSRLDRQKLQKAVTAVVEGGMKVAEAAEQCDVDLEKLKEALSGTRAKHKGAKHGIETLQRTITFTYKSVGSKNASALKALLEKYEDGDVTPDQVREVIHHIETCQKQSARSVADWKRRFEVKASANTGKPADESAA